MSYAIYKTEAIVLRMIPSGETSMNVVFLTRDLGKITARAQAARGMSSKMRMHVTRYRHVVIDLVRGKNIWRLTGISEKENAHTTPLQITTTIFPKIARLVEYLVVGEMNHPELFNNMITLRDQEHTFLDHPHYHAFETFGVIKVLEKLGYWDGILLPDAADEMVLEKCFREKKQLIPLINQSFIATQIMV